MSSVTRDHYTAFGALIYSYATVEFGIKAAVAGILEVPFVEALIVTEPYSALQLKNVAKSLTKEARLSAEHRQQFIQIVGDWGAFSGLRNQIAHCRWEEGDRPGSIRPIGLDIRSGTAKWIVAEDTRDWTATEIGSEAIKVATINERLQQFHRDAGLLAIIDRKDAERSARTED